MNRKTPFRSLSIQLLLGVLVSLFLAVLCFALFYALGNGLLDHTVYGESFSDTMSDRQFEQLHDRPGQDRQIQTDPGGH